MPGVSCSGLISYKRGENMNFKFISDGHGRGKVYLDGEELKGVVSVNISAGVGEMNRVNIELLTDKLEVQMAEFEREGGPRTL